MIKNIFSKQDALSNLDDLQVFLNDHQGGFVNWKKIPVFGGSIPFWDGVLYDEKTKTNNSDLGYSGTFEFSVISWDQDRLLVCDVAEPKRPIFIIERKEFFKMEGIGI